MKKLVVVLVVLGALLIGYQLGIDRDPEPAPVASEPNPFDQFDPPGTPATVVDTSSVDHANAEIQRADQARRDAQAIADEVAAAQRRQRYIDGE